MTLREKAIDNSVKYIPQSEQTRKREIKPNTIKKMSNPSKQNKKLPKNNKKFVKDIVLGEGFRIFRKKVSFYF